MENGVADSESSEHPKKNSEEKSNECLKNFISNMVFVSVSVSDSGSGEEKKEEEEDDEEEKKGNGGIINNLISHLVSPRSLSSKETGEGSVLKDGGSQAVEENDKAAVGHGGGGGGGIIDNIVSHLPASLQGDAVTTADEATILIHSIIHD